MVSSPSPQSKLEAKQEAQSTSIRDIPALRPEVTMPAQRRKATSTARSSSSSKAPQLSSAPAARANVKPRKSSENEDFIPHFLAGLIRPFKIMWTFRFLFVYFGGFLLGLWLVMSMMNFVLRLLNLHNPLLSGFKAFGNLFSSKGSGSTALLFGAASNMSICSAPLASVWLSHCAKQKRSERELRRRLGLAESAEYTAKFTSGMVDLVAQTPHAQYVQRVSNGAYTLSQAFRMRATVPSAPQIASDLDKIGEETEKMVDSIIEVEVQGRVAVSDMMAGNKELKMMLEQQRRYSADVIERRLDRFVDSTDGLLATLQEQLISAQQSASRVMSIQRSLRGKLLLEQSDLQEQDIADRDARSLVSSLRRVFESRQQDGLSEIIKPLSPLESHRLQKNLDLLNVAMDDIQAWQSQLSEYSVYLRSYRSQVSARKRQLSVHQWSSEGLSIEHRIEAIGRLLEPAQQRLAQLEQGRAEDDSAKSASGKKGQPKSLPPVIEGKDGGNKEQPEHPV
ncbi:hypothetical protein OC846_001309 [Tilletia horrida]|uniref:Uncharacterized protein n=1 Tax=Tilletia horrida TaxID=155126 RepID=A0AAN6GW93_9BASI|nr:hypothetical protein OC846_001309 [Tilletia horrida]